MKPKRRAWISMRLSLGLVALVSVLSLWVATFQTAEAAVHQPDHFYRAANPMHRLNPGGSLTPGQSIYSDDGDYQFILQSDGNLVLYYVGGGSHDKIWASGTDGTAVKEADMRTDGNLVLVKYDGSWACTTGTNNHPGAYLSVQNDGNLVIYPHGDGDRLWASKSGDTCS